MQVICTNPLHYALALDAGASRTISFDSDISDDDVDDRGERVVDDLGDCVRRAWRTGRG